MKRKALLIGNTHGLNGVKVDMQSFNNFLQSQKGGAWYSTEIETMLNVSRSGLLTKLSSLKAEKFDYLIVLFSGHGGQVRETVLELNGNSEKVSESELKGLAGRQLNIFDCCRVESQPKMESLAKAMNFQALDEAKSKVRERYEKRILQAIPQQVSLYSCSVGQPSYDTANGGVYLQNLLKAANTLTGDFKLVSVAHQEAIDPTVLHSIAQKGELQRPDAVLPKCLSDQQLIISIKP